MSASVRNLLDLLRQRWLLDIAGVVLLLVVGGTISARLFAHMKTTGPASLDRWGLASFRDAVYYPIVAVREGVNPYDSVRDNNPDRYMNRYDVASHFPLYSPLLLLLFAPLGWLSLAAAMLVYVAITVALLIFFAWSSLRVCQLPTTLGSTCGLAAVILASQPGRGNFNAGQAILLFAIAASLALGMTKHRWAQAASIALLTCKPTLGGPIGLLLFARRDYFTSIVGLALGGIVAIGGMAFIFARSGDTSAEHITSVIQGNLDHFSGDPEHQFAHTCHLDIATAASKITGVEFPGGTGISIALLILLVTGIVLWIATSASKERAVKSLESPASVTSALLLVATFVCVYHLIYDALLLVVPILAAMFVGHASWRAVPRSLRLAAALLLLVPMGNVLWTEGFSRLMHKLSIAFGPGTGLVGETLFRFTLHANAIALFLCWMLLLYVVLTTRKTREASHLAAAIEGAS